MRKLLAAIAFAGAASLIWVTRNETLPPTGQRVAFPIQSAELINNGAIETVVVCTANRWTGDVSCKRVPIWDTAAMNVLANTARESLNKKMEDRR